MTGWSAAKVLNDTTVSPGVLGFAVFLLLALATALLLRSFTKQLRKVRAHQAAEDARTAPPSSTPGNTPPSATPPGGPSAR
jgi:hypothetical protein